MTAPTVPPATPPATPPPAPAPEAPPPAPPEPEVDPGDSFDDEEFATLSDLEERLNDVVGAVEALKPAAPDPMEDAPDHIRALGESIKGVNEKLSKIEQRDAEREREALVAAVTTHVDNTIKTYKMSKAEVESTATFIKHMQRTRPKLAAELTFEEAARLRHPEIVSRLTRKPSPAPPAGGAPNGNGAGASPAPVGAGGSEPPAAWKPTREHTHEDIARHTLASGEAAKLVKQS